PLAAEQIAAELAFKLSDGAGKRRLGHMTFLRGARAIQGARHGEEVADLMHFHRNAPRPASSDAIAADYRQGNSRGRDDGSRLLAKIRANTCTRICLAPCWEGVLEPRKRSGRAWLSRTFYA